MFVFRLSNLVRWSLIPESGERTSYSWHPPIVGVKSSRFQVTCLTNALIYDSIPIDLRNTFSTKHLSIFPLVDAYLTHNSFIHSTALAATNLVDVMVLHVRFQTFMVYCLPLLYGIVSSSMSISQLFLDSLQLLVALHEHQEMQESHQWLTLFRKGWNCSSPAKMLREVLSAPEMIVVARHVCVVYMRPCSVSSSM